MNNRYRNNQQVALLHSFSTNDASLGEYKFTVTVGQSSVKITGDNLELVRAAKLVLEDHFSNAEFDVEATTYETQSGSGAGVVYDNYRPMQVPASHQLVTTGSPMVDSGIALDKMTVQRSNSNNSQNSRYQKQKSETEDDVFIVEENGQLISVQNVAKTPNAANGGLSRSKKTNSFPRKSLSPEAMLDRVNLKREIDQDHKSKYANLLNRRNNQLSRSKYLLNIPTIY